jgi:hypothetical protein
MKILRPLPIDISGDISLRISKKKLSPAIQYLYFNTIMHPTFRNAQDGLLECFEMSGLEGVGCTLLGEPGVGKSRAIRYLASEVYSRPEYQPSETLTPLPILVIKVPGKPTIKRLIEKLLESAGHLAPSPKSSESGEIRFNRLVRNQQVQMIVFDEVQHLLRKFALVRTHDIMAFIKVLMDEHALSICFAGLPEANELLEPFPELRQRLSYVNSKLYRFKYQTTGPCNLEELLGYLSTIDEQLDGFGVGCERFATEDMLPRMWLASQGIPRYLTKLMVRVTRFAERKGAINRDEFQAVYNTCGFNEHVEKFEVFKAPLHKVIERANRFQAELNAMQNPPKRKSR